MRIFSLFSIFLSILCYFPQKSTASAWKYDTYYQPITASQIAKLCQNLPKDDKLIVDSLRRSEYYGHITTAVRELFSSYKKDKDSVRKAQFFLFSYILMQDRNSRMVPPDRPQIWQTQSAISDDRIDLYGLVDKILKNSPNDAFSWQIASYMVFPIDDVIRIASDGSKMVRPSPAQYKEERRRAYKSYKLAPNSPEYIRTVLRQYSYGAPLKKSSEGYLDLLALSAKGVRLDPKSSRLWLYYSQHLFEAKHYKEALTAYQRSQSLIPPEKRVPDLYFLQDIQKGLKMKKQQ